MNSAPRSILVFRNGSLGNTLAAVPTLRAIHKRWPDVPITVVVDSLGQELLEYCPYVTQLVPYEKRGKDRGLTAHLRLIAKLRSSSPSHTVVIKRFFRNGLLSYLSGAKVRIGFHTDGKAPFLNRTIPYDESIHIVDLNLRLAGLLSADTSDRSLEIFLGEEDKLQADQILSENGVKGKPYIVAHYGGRTTAPDFVSLTGFIELIRRVALDRFVLLIGHGETEEQHAVQIAERLSASQSVCNLPVRTAACLIQKAAFYIGFNTGPSHLAASTKTPGVVLYPSRPDIEGEIRKWKPIYKGLLPLIASTDKNEELWEKTVLTAVEHSMTWIKHNSPA